MRGWGVMSDDPARVDRSAQPVAKIDESQTKLRAVRRVAYSLHEVVITGIGVILPNCDTREEFWRQLSEGESQLSLERPDPSDDSTCAVGRIHDFDAQKYFAGVPEPHTGACTREQPFYL